MDSRDTVGLCRGRESNPHGTYVPRDFKCRREHSDSLPTHIDMQLSANSTHRPAQIIPLLTVETATRPPQ